MNDKVRAEFEAMFGAPPYEEDLRRFPDDDGQDWPGQYRSIDVQRAWAAWLASRTLAIEEAAQRVTHKAESVARVNTYRGKVNAASLHAVGMLEDAAISVRALLTPRGEQGAAPRTGSSVSGSPGSESTRPSEQDAPGSSIGLGAEGEQ